MDMSNPPPPVDEGPRVTHDQIKDLTRLRRSTTDRKIAGVAGGIARHLDIDPVIVRIVLVVLAFFGGGGIVLYGAIWLLVPDDNGHSTIDLDDRNRTIALWAVGVLAALSIVSESFGGIGVPWPLWVAGIVLFLVLAKHQRGEAPGGPHGHGHSFRHGWHGPQTQRGWVGEREYGERAYGEPAAPAEPGASYATYEPGVYQPPPPQRDPHKRGPIMFGRFIGLSLLALGTLLTLELAGVDLPASAYPAAVAATAGLLLVISSVWGRGGGLILFGLVAAAAMAVASLPTAVDNFAVGQISRTPQTAADVTALDDHYSLVAGEIVIDLAELGPDELAALDDTTLSLETTFGQVRVIVPDEGLDVEASARVTGGEITLFGDREHNEVDRSWDGGDDVPTLTLSTAVTFGEIKVQTQEVPR